MSFDGGAGNPNIKRHFYFQQMAKEDFCFTYYDGDAARDKAHMTRLCRGAYDDILSMQRKVGRMSLDVIKMVLSSDFETCWPSLNFILKVDENCKYYIEWVENSVSKMRQNSEKQKENVAKRWAKENEGKNTAVLKNDTTVLKNIDLVIPLENGNGNEYVLENKEENIIQFPSEKNIENFDLPEIKIGAVIQLAHITRQVTLNEKDVLGLWHVFKVQNFTGKKYYADVGDIHSHFINWCKDKKNKIVENGTNRKTYDFSDPAFKP